MILPRLRQRGSEQFRIRRCRRHAVFLALNQQQGHREPGTERRHLGLSTEARGLHETGGVGRVQSLLHQSQSISRSGRTEQCRRPFPETIAAAFNHAGPSLDTPPSLLGRHGARDTGTGEHRPPDPPGVVIGETLRDARAERVSDDVELIDLEGRQQVTESIGIIAAARRFGPQIVAQQIAWGIPGDQPEAIGEADQLIASVQRVGADAMQ